MGNQHSASHAVLKPRKNVHWKSAGRPAAPGKPDIIPILSDDEPNSITLRWAPPDHDGGAPLKGYQVECNRLGSADWIRTAPPVVLRPELVLSGLEPPHRYQFRVAALNVVGRSEYSELSDVLTVSSDRSLQEAPLFLQQLEDVTVLENDKTEFRVSFSGSPTPTIAWFKDDYEIFSSRRTAITTNEFSSVLIFHQTLSSDEGEIKCTATNRAGHAVTKARLSLEAAPKLRYPRQYEDGLLYEINETVFLKTTIVGKPTPTIEWRHDGQPIVGDGRVEITNTPKFSVLKIQSAKRSDRGEYQIHAKNNIGEDTAAFLVTITAPPDPPRRVSVTRQVDKSITLDWEPPEDDGGCRIGNYVIEYYRSGWNVWLKATTSRKTNVTLFDLIEGSEYRFRVKAESPYGMSAPSAESAPVKIPGRSVDMEFLEVESRIINEVLKKEDSQVLTVSPAPRRKRLSGSASVSSSTPEPEAPPTKRFSEAPPKVQLRTAPERSTRASPSRDHTGSSEFMLVLYPDKNKSADKAEKRKSFQLDLEDALSPPPISLSAPELSSRCVMPFKALRNAVSSTELLHEQAMARFYKAVAMKEEQTKHKSENPIKPEQNHIPYNNINHDVDERRANHKVNQSNKQPPKTPEIFTKTDSLESKEEKNTSQQVRQGSENSETRWQHSSFDEDYTASTVSTDGDYSDEGSLNGDIDRTSQYSNEEETYNPRDKAARSLSPNEAIEEEEEESERETLKPLRLPDPNFVPKPILKRREPLEPTIEVNTEKTALKNDDKKEEKKKEGKMTIFKKITKMPVQKPFPFSKIRDKKDSDKVNKQNVLKPEKSTVNKIENVDEKLGDEGKTVIDYYGNIVKEYGSNKKPSVPLYLNTEDLKNVAEKQQLNKVKTNPEQKKNIEEKKNTKTKKAVVKKTENNIAAKPKPKKSMPEKQIKPNLNKSKPEKKINAPPPQLPQPSEKVNKPISSNKSIDKVSQETQILIRKAERATIVIPIDYQKLEQRAKMNVRSVIDYTVDVCLLLLAFWVYFFKDERLAIPFLILIIYRQLQETLFLNIPEWINRHTPSWLKKKTS